MKQRVITSIIGLIIFVPVILYGKLPFLILAYLVATIALFELIRMYNIRKIATYLIASLFFLWLLLYPSLELTINTFTITKFDILVLFLVFLLSLTVISKNKFTFDNAAFLLFATTYVGTAFYFIIVTRFEGLNYLLFVLFIIWATDTGAYFFGRAFGKRKLWPEISPNKTIGGAIGGILIATIVGTVFQLVYPFSQSFVMVILITVIISIVGQMGDLVASAFKRHYNVKDTGNIFPGHGGILDRLDSFVFVMLVLHLINFV